MNKGRPSKISNIDIEHLKKLCEAGLTDKQLAVALKIDKQTIYNYKKKYPDFFDSIKKGKEVADKKVKESLFSRACGYNHPEEKIFCNKDGKVTKVNTIKHYPPETLACIFWLKNRLPKDWKDRVEHTGVDGEALKMIVETVSSDKLKQNG